MLARLRQKLLLCFVPQFGKAIEFLELFGNPRTDCIVVNLLKPLISSLLTVNGGARAADPPSPENSLQAILDPNAVTEYGP